MSPAVRTFTKLAALCLALPLGACRTAAAHRPLRPVPSVDLSRYMGRWYVIASIPTRWERDAYNQTETYQLEADGRIRTSFDYRRGGFEGPAKTIHSTATVLADRGNAAWRVHFFWLLHAQYLIAWLAPDYSRVIVARDARDYVWLMARTPQISPSDDRSMREQVAAMGYDLEQLRPVPQQWPPAPSSSMSRSPGAMTLRADSLSSRR
jgi:apolipoprotein D and lipocalin family protein